MSRVPRGGAILPFVLGVPDHVLLVAMYPRRRTRWKPIAANTLGLSRNPHERRLGYDRSPANSKKVFSSNDRGHRNCSVGTTLGTTVGITALATAINAATSTLAEARRRYRRRHWRRGGWYGYPRRRYGYGYPYYAYDYGYPYRRRGWWGPRFGIGFGF